ncbi:MAG: hypothetical protein FWG12_03875 [Holophagaceae bacterium]|nr:hypothetical protein [Holophagaceae bacterium]
MTIKSVEVEAGNYALEHKIKLNLGDKTGQGSFSGGGGGGTGGGETGWSEPYAMVTAYPNNLDRAIVGIPFRFQFNAADINNPSNDPKDWIITDGRQKILDINWDEVSATRPIDSWISQAGEKPKAGEVGTAFEIYRSYPGNDDHYWPHEMIFVAPREGEDGYVEPNTKDSKISFGVGAKFASPQTIAQQNFYITVVENNAPYWLGSSATANVRRAGVTVNDLTVYNEDKWPGVYANHTLPIGERYPWNDGLGAAATVANLQGAGSAIANNATAVPGIVFAGAETGSYPMSANITFTGVVSDVDLPWDEVIDFNLKKIYVADGWNLTASGASTTLRISAHNDYHWHQHNRVPDGTLDGYANPTTTSIVANAQARLAARDVTSQVKPFLTAETGKATYTYSGGESVSFTGKIGFETIPTSGTITWSEHNSGGGNADNADSSLNDHGLLFVYSAEDLGGNEVTFSVYVGTRDNTAPVIDDFSNPPRTWIPSNVNEEWEGHIRSKGDILRRHDGWVNVQPNEDADVNWTIAWSQGADTSNKPGTQPERFRMADEIWRDPVYMEILEQPWEARGDDEGQSITVAPAGALNSHSATWSLLWNPDYRDARKQYAFTMGAWDKYGARAEDATLEGLVYGMVYGEQVAKKIYRYEYNEDKTGPIVNWGTDEAYADFSSRAWASINLVPFYDHPFMTDEDYFRSWASDNNWTNEYTAGGKYLDENGLPDRQVYNDSKRWKAYMVPPGHYLVSMGHYDGSGNAPAVPTVGPAVRSTNLLYPDYALVTDPNIVKLEDGITPVAVADIGKVGYEHAFGTWKASEYREAFDFAGGNRAAYAYISSTNPDLTTYVGSGILATKLDSSVGHALNGDYYDFGLAPYARVEDIATAPGTEELAYWGLDLDAARGGADPLHWPTVYGNDIFPLLPLRKKDLIYTGNMVMIQASDLIPETDAIQFSFPSIGQTAFFSILDTGEPLTESYPASAYSRTLGWNGELGKPVLGTATGAHITTDKEASYREIQFNLSPDARPTTNTNAFITANATGGNTTDILPFAAAEKDVVSFATMIREDRSIDVTFPQVGTTAAATRTVNYPTWHMSTTGVVQPEDQYTEISGFDATGGAETADLPHQRSEFGSVGVAKTFTPTINRTSFGGTQLPYLVGQGSANMSDTFRVVAYVNGTDLGPVENHFGVPTLLEFGSLSTQIGGVSDSTVSGRILQGSVPLGTYPIPRPSQRYWYGGEDTPVAVYTATFGGTSVGVTSNIPGSMGHIQDISAGGAITVSAMDRVSNVRITSKSAYDTTARTNIRHNNVSSLISPSIISGSSITAPSRVNVRAYQTTNGSADRPKVWLSWERPANASGYIIEFFVVPVSGTGNVLLPAGTTGADLVPAYKVYVDPAQDRFPIPDAWIETFQGEYSTGVNKDVVARIRSVQYGVPGEDSFVNFNDSPYKQALPAKWTDVVTSRLNFNNTDDAIGQNIWTQPFFGASTPIGWSPAALTLSIPSLITAGGVVTTPYPIYTGIPAPTIPEGRVDVTVTPAALKGDIKTVQWIPVRLEAADSLITAAKADFSDLDTVISGTIVTQNGDGTFDTTSVVDVNNAANPTFSLLAGTANAYRDAWRTGDKITFDVELSGYTVDRGGNPHGAGAGKDEPITSEDVKTVTISLMDIGSDTKLTGATTNLAVEIKNGNQQVQTLTSAGALTPFTWTNTENPAGLTPGLMAGGLYEYSWRLGSGAERVTLMGTFGGSSAVWLKSTGGAIVMPELQLSGESFFGEGSADRDLGLITSIPLTLSVRRVATAGASTTVPGASFTTDFTVNCKYSTPKDPGPAAWGYGSFMRWEQQTANVFIGALGTPSQTISLYDDTFTQSAHTAEGNTIASGIAADGTGSSVSPVTYGAPVVNTSSAGTTTITGLTAAFGSANEIDTLQLVTGAVPPASLSPNTNYYVKTTPTVVFNSETIPGTVPTIVVVTSKDFLTADILTAGSVPVAAKGATDIATALSGSIFGTPGTQFSFVGDGFAYNGGLPSGYTATWEITGATGTLSLADAAAEITLVQTNPFNPTADAAANTFAGGDTVTFTVTITSPYGTKPQQKLSYTIEFEA